MLAGTHSLGGRKTDPWAVDQKKWAHPVSLPAFQIRRTPDHQRRVWRLLCARETDVDMLGLPLRCGALGDGAVARPHSKDPALTRASQCTH